MFAMDFDEAGAPDPFNLGHHLRGEGVGPHGRQRDRHLGRGQPVHQGLEQSGQGAVVADAEAQEGHLFEAGGGQGGRNPRQGGSRVPFPHRPVNHAGLAVTAAPGAAAGNLHVEAVVDNLTGGDQGEGWEGYAVQIVQDPLGHSTPAPLGDDGPRHPGLVEVHGKHRRDVDAFQLLQGLPQLAAGAAVGLPIRHQRRQFQNDFFPVAQDQGVKEGRHRLGVEAGGAATDDHRVAIVAVRGQKRHAPQVQHVQEVGIA